MPKSVTLSQRRSHLSYFDNIQPSVSFEVFQKAFLNDPQLRSTCKQLTITEEWLREFKVSLLLLNDKSPGLSHQERKSMMTRAVWGAFRSSVEGQDNVWASDGSAITDEVGRMTMTAMCGPWSATFHIIGQPAGSRHGEIMGLIAAAIGCSSHTRQGDCILTYYANGVTAVKTMRSPGFDAFRWLWKPAAEWLMWLHDTFRGVDCPIKHIKAHTDSKDVCHDLAKHGKRQIIPE